MPSHASRPILAVLTIALVSLGLFGCGSDEKPPTGPASDGGGPTLPTTTDFTGIYVGQNVGGKLIVTFDRPGLAAGFGQDRPGGAPSGARAVVTVNATARLSITGGSVVTLMGSYNEILQRAYLTGDGGYALEAYRYYTLETASSILVGTVTGPSQGKIYCYNSQTDSVRVYEGSFENAGQTAPGRWNFATVDTVVFGVAWPDSEPDGGIFFTGAITRTGDPRTILLYDQSAQYVLTASGALDVASGAVTGTWEAEDPAIPATDSGTWSSALVP